MNNMGWPAEEHETGKGSDRGTVYQLPGSYVSKISFFAAASTASSIFTLLDLPGLPLFQFHKPFLEILLADDNTIGNSD